MTQDRHSSVCEQDPGTAWTEPGSGLRTIRATRRERKPLRDHIGVAWLQHEGRMYGRLKRLQRVVVPVYQGSIGYIDLGVEIVHMLLMSWGGEVAMSSDAVDLPEEIHRSVDEIHGVWSYVRTEYPVERREAASDAGRL